VSDNDVRLHLYRRFVETGAPPTAAETAEALGTSREEAEAAYRRLEQARVIVLAPGTTNVWMSNPLSAVPTPFRVETSRRSYWANCAWDAFGLLAMLESDGRVETWCGDCGDPMTLQVEGGMVRGEGIGHFAVPARRWWDNIGFT
jgi:hypothetical protein